MYQTMRQPGAQQAGGNMIPTGMQVGMGVRPVAIQKIWTQGDYQQTDNQLDIAIEGDGFFLIQKDNEDVYTRDGSFKLNNNRDIVDSNGNLLVPQMTVPENTTSITVDPNGLVTALASDGVATELGNIQLYTFPNASGLMAAGRNYFRETPASGAPVAGDPGTDQYGTLAQGFLEMSNVSVVDEMVNMIVAQRAYEANSKAITTADQMLQTANQVKR